MERTVASRTLKMTTNDIGKTFFATITVHEVQEPVIRKIGELHIRRIKVFI